MAKLTYGNYANLSGNGNTISIRFEYASPNQVTDLIEKSKSQNKKYSVIRAYGKCEYLAAMISELLCAYSSVSKSRFEARNIIKYLERLLELCAVIESHNSFVHAAISRGVMFPDCDCDCLMIKTDGMPFEKATEKSVNGNSEESPYIIVVPSNDRIATISKTHFMFKYIFDKLFTIADTEMKAAMLEFNRIYFQQDGFEKMFEMTL